MGAVFYTINTALAQQVVPDNTLPNNSVVNNLEKNITNITGGIQRGGNLEYPLVVKLTLTIPLT
ncbi:MAG: hypothetical protein ACFB2X_02355 [Rivularia sp. (in: cyanobacteria)]